MISILETRLLVGGLPACGDKMKYSKLDYEIAELRGYKWFTHTKYKWNILLPDTETEIETYTNNGWIRGYTEGYKDVTFHLEIKSTRLDDAWTLLLEMYDEDVPLGLFLNQKPKMVAIDICRLWVDWKNGRNQW